MKFVGCSMFRLMFFPFLVLMPQLSAKAGDLIDRLKQYSVESTIFEFPSVLHFDFVVQEESESAITQARYLGRQVIGGLGKRRLDFVKIATTALGESRSFEHYLELSKSERFYVFRIDGGKPQAVKVEDGKNSVRCLIGFINPFHFALLGGQELAIPSRDPAEDIISRFVDLPESKNIIRNRGEDAVSAWKLEFDSELQWQLRKATVYRSFKGCNDPDFGKWSRTTEKTIFGDWHVSLEVHSKWREVDGELIPIYVHSFAQNHDCNDPSMKEDFEGLFFDCQFQNLEVDAYFNKDRLSEEFLFQDFSVDKLEKQSKTAKSQLD